MIKKYNIIVTKFGEKSFEVYSEELDKTFYTSHAVVENECVTFSRVSGDV